MLGYEGKDFKSCRHVLGSNRKQKGIRSRKKRGETSKEQGTILTSQVSFLSAFRTNAEK